MGILEALSGGDDPGQQRAMTALAMGLLSGGNFNEALSKGLGAAMNASDAYNERTLKNKLTNAQLAQLEMQRQAQEQNLKFQKIANERWTNLIGGQQPQLTIGSALPLEQTGAGVAADPMGFDPSQARQAGMVIPQVKQVPVDPNDAIRNLSAADVEMLERGGIKVADTWKFLNTPHNAPGGSYVFSPGQQPRYLDKVPDGMRPSGDGLVNTPGYTTALSQQEFAKEVPKAALDVKPNAQGQGVTRLQIAQSADPTLGGAFAAPAAPKTPDSPTGQTKWAGGELSQQQISALTALANSNDKNAPEAKRALADYAAWKGQGTGIQLEQSPKQRLSNEAIGETNKVWLQNQYKSALADGDNASKLLTTIGASKQALAAIGPTGWGTEAKAAAADILTGLGIAPNRVKVYASNVAVFNAQASERLWSVLNAATGPQTEGDANRAKQTYASLKTPELANAYILDLSQAVAERNLAKSKFYNNALPIAQQKGDLAEVDREWQKRAPSVFDMPSMARWKGGVK